MWKDLVEVLGKIYLAYQDMLNLGGRKKAALIGVDMKGLEKLLEEEKILAHRVQELENKRKGILRQLMEENKAIRPDSKLVEMYAFAPSRPIENRLKELHKKLDDCIKEVQKLNSDNMVLTQGALQAVSFHLNRIGGASVDPTYGNTGRDTVSHEKKFDFKA